MRCLVVTEFCLAMAILTGCQAKEQPPQRTHQAGGEATTGENEASLPSGPIISSDQASKVVPIGHSFSRACKSKTTTGGQREEITVDAAKKSMTSILWLSDSPNCDHVNAVAVYSLAYTLIDSQELADGSIQSRFQAKVRDITLYALSDMSASSSQETICGYTHWPKGELRSVAGASCFGLSFLKVGSEFSGEALTRFSSSATSLTLSDPLHEHEEFTGSKEIRSNPFEP